jgi:hypothetical protein
LIKIPEERLDDLAAVPELNRRAFGEHQESNIVDALRANGAAFTNFRTYPRFREQRELASAIGVMLALLMN